MEVLQEKLLNDPAILRKIIAITADGVFDSSGNIFRQLVNKIRSALNVSHAYIGEVCEDDSDSVRVIFANFNGETVENAIVSLDGSPCKNVINQIYRYYPRDVTKLFPQDREAVDFNIEGYAAIPLFNSKGKSQGLMVIMNTEPLTDPELTEALLKIFSVRASIELERLYTKHASKKTEEQYQTIFNKSLDGLILVTLDGKIVDVNPAGAEMHGYTREEVLNMRPDQFIPPESRQAFHDFVKAVAENKPFHTVANGIRKDGSRYLADVRGVYMEYRGKPHLMAILRDVTEQVERESELRDSKDRLRATIDVSMDCIIAINSEGHIIEFNPAAEHTFGFKKENAIGRPLANMIIPERYQAAHNHALTRRNIRNMGEPLVKRREITAKRADGTEFPVELTIDVARDKSGDIYIGYIRDITDRKQAEMERNRLEAQLRQSQKMQAIGHLAGGIAHDFNNILTGVLGYIVMAQEKAQVVKDEKIINYLERAQKSGQKARDLIQQLLTFSRGQRGEPRAVCVKTLVQEAVKLMGSTLPATIEIITRFDEKLPNIHVDPVHIEQVLMNLCINARDAMKNSGKLTITVKNSTCSDEYCSSCKKIIFGQFVELSVEDTGTGIPTEELDRIFEPFYSTKEVGKGTGMGLSTVHGIVHEYNSHIIVDTRPGQGSTFRIMLKPILQVKNPEEISSADDDYTHAGPEQLKGRILLVDDEIIVSEFMVDLLESWGLNVTCFNSSTDALEFFENNASNFDLAILDQSMPKLTGLELAGKIRTKTPSLPVMMYTGYSDNISPQKLKSLNILALLKKPVDVPELRAILEEILQTA